MGVMGSRGLMGLMGAGLHHEAPAGAKGLQASQRDTAECGTRHVGASSAGTSADVSCVTYLTKARGKPAAERCAPKRGVHGGGGRGGQASACKRRCGGKRWSPFKRAASESGALHGPYSRL